MKTKNLLNLITGSVFVMILLISCNGCRSGKVSDKQDVATSQPANVYQEVNPIPDTNKYLFQDDPVLSKLKLTRIPKGEAIAEYGENGNVLKCHLFNEDGKYIGIFDTSPYEKDKDLDSFIKKYQNPLKEPLEITDKNRDIYWRELKSLGFDIPKKEFVKMRFLYGTGLDIWPQFEIFYEEGPPKILGFIGLRTLCLSEDNKSGECPILFRETYLFDKMGKLIKTYDKDEMGEYLWLYDKGNKGISQYLNSPWDEMVLKYFRYHNFNDGSYLDFNPFTICNDFTYGSWYSRNPYFVDIQEDYIHMVYISHDVKQETHVSLIIDVNTRTAYCKLYEIKFIKGQEWKFFTKPDGTKVDLSQYEEIKF